LIQTKSLYIGSIFFCELAILFAKPVDIPGSPRIAEKRHFDATRKS
jgi:hypothetical protein